MSKDQAIGLIILIICVVVMVGYPVALYVWPGLGELARNAAFLLVAIPVSLAIILIFAIGAWIGWTMATTPPPKPINEIESELSEDETKTTTKSSDSTKRKQE